MTSPWQVAFVALTVLVAALTVVVLGLLRRVGAVLERLEHSEPGDTGPVLGLRPGAQVAEFEVFTAAGGRVTLPQQLPDTAAVLLFVEPDCEACEELIGQLRNADWAAGLAPLLIVLPQGADAALAVPPPTGVHLLYQRNRTASDAFRANVSPLAYAIDSAGVVQDRLIPPDLESLQDFTARVLPRHGRVDIS